MNTNPIRRKKGYSIPSPRPGGVGLASPGYWYAVCPKCSQEITAGHRYVRNLGRGRKAAKDALWRHLKTKHKNTWRALVEKTEAASAAEVSPEVCTCPVT